MTDAVDATVIAAIAELKKIPPETITLDCTLEELRIDSLDGLNLFFELEEAFDMTIPDEKARSLRTVRQIVEELQHLLTERNAPDAGPPGPS